VVGAVVVGLMLWQGQLPQAPGGEPNAPGAQAEGLDVATYTHVSEVRQGLGLSDPALAAMGCGQGAAEAVLGRLVTWCEANRAAWEARRSATADARRRVREAVREANVGPADPGRARRIAQLEAALPAAVAEEQALLADARTYVEAAMTDGQKALWATIRANPPAAGGLAYAVVITHIMLPGRLVLKAVV